MSRLNLTMPATADWVAPEQGSRLGGLITLAFATVLSFSAGVGASWLYLEAGRERAIAPVPLVEADKSPTRVRPDGLDEAGRPLAAVGNLAAPGQAMAAVSEPSLALPIQGIPEAPEITPPPEAHLVVNLAPESAAPPMAAPAPQPVPPPRFIETRVFRLQLASMRTEAAAKGEMERLNRIFAGQLTKLRLSVERIDEGRRGIYYRVISSGLDEQASAKDVCGALTARRAQCMVMATKSIAPAPPVEMAAAAPAAKPAAVAEAAPRPAIRAQLASLRSLVGATRELNRLSRLYADVLARTELTVSRIDLGERGVFYRILTGPFASRSAASELCQRLGTNQAGCVLIPQRSSSA